MLHVRRSLPPIRPTAFGTVDHFLGVDLPEIRNGLIGYVLCLNALMIHVASRRCQNSEYVI